MRNCEVKAQLYLCYKKIPCYLPFQKVPSTAMILFPFIFLQDRE